MKTRYLGDETIDDPLATREFHELAMAYRHAQTGGAEWKALTTFMRSHLVPRGQSTAQLHVIQPGNLRNVPETLRTLADQIEAGDFGTVEALAWTLDADQGYALGLIGGDHPSDAHLLFTVAAAAMVQAVLQQKAQL